jgi:alkanesulfonate monooxygenase SsuD/methylene tetrahydromethanopterin reductase-like flavin-dependent oxidoreductase (luciferase family)
MTDQRVEYFANLVGSTVDPASWARARESEGWHGLGVADHIWSGRTAFSHWAVTLGQIAAVTRHVQLISCFGNNLLRSPVEFAQAALTLQRASNGRFEAGLGAGWARDEVEGSGLRFPNPGERLARYSEAIEILRRLLRDGACSFAGEHYRVEVPIIGPSVDTAPPIVVAVGGPRSIREVGPLGDRIELTFNAAATRGGELRRDHLGELGRAHLAELLDQARTHAPDVPKGIFLTIACGDDEGVAQLRASGALGIPGLAGTPQEVAQTVIELVDDDISRVQLTPATPTTLESIAPFLPLNQR